MMIVVIIIVVMILVVSAGYFMYWQHQERTSRMKASSSSAMETESAATKMDITSLPIYCINLESEIQRRAHIQRIFLGQGLQVEMVPAVDTRGSLWMEYSHHITMEGLTTMYRNLQTNKRKEHYELTPGAIGCFLSHLKAWDVFMRTEAEMCLVLEDDSSPLPEFKEKLGDVLQRIPSDMDLFLFNHIVNGEKTVVDVDILRIEPPTIFYYLNAYLITRKGIQKIMNDLDARHGRFYKQIDSHLSDLVNDRVITIYFHRENICPQTLISGTSIQTIPI